MHVSLFLSKVNLRLYNLSQIQLRLESKLCARSRHLSEGTEKRRGEDEVEKGEWRERDGDDDTWGRGEGEKWERHPRARGKPTTPAFLYYMECHRYEKIAKEKNTSKKEDFYGPTTKKALYFFL